MGSGFHTYSTDSALIYLCDLFPEDFFPEKYLADGKNYYNAKAPADTYQISAYFETNLGRFAYTDEVAVRWEVEPENIFSVQDSYTFDTEDIKSGKYVSGDIQLFTVYPGNLSITPDFRIFRILSGFFAP